METIKLPITSTSAQEDKLNQYHNTILSMLHTLRNQGEPSMMEEKFRKVIQLLQLDESCMPKEGIRQRNERIRRFKSRTNYPGDCCGICNPAADRDWNACSNCSALFHVRCLCSTTNANKCVACGSEIK